MKETHEHFDIKKPCGFTFVAVAMPTGVPAGAAVTAAEATERKGDSTSIGAQTTVTDPFPTSVFSPDALSGDSAR